MNDTVMGHDAIGGATARAKPDPNVVLPSAVKKAAERANELAASIKSGNAPPPPPPSARASSGVQMTDFDPRNPNPPTEASLLQGVSSASADAQLRSAPPTAPAAPPPPVAPEPNSGDWEHQFKSLKGRYEREQETNRRMAQQIGDMQRMMAQISTPSSASPVPSQGSGVRFDGPAAGAGRYVTAKEIEEYGSELMDVMGRRAREVYEPVIAQLAGELNQVKHQIGGVRNSQAYDASVKMYDVLSKEVPNWNEVNNSAEFARWLDQPDPMTGVMRRELLNYAHRNNLTSRVVGVFKGFLADVAVYSPANYQLSPGNGAAGYLPAPSTPQVDLMQFAAPGRAKSGQTQVPPEKPIFNASDINQFYRDKTAGKYVGREQEANVLEAALFEASREGRIRR